MKDELLMEGDRIALDHYARETGGITVEIGTYLGGSAKILAEGSKKVYCIDVFEDIDLIKNKEAKKECKDIWKDKGFTYKDIKAKLESVYENIEVIKGESEQVAKEWKKEQIDLIFIDGDHTYEGVKTDFESWFPHLRKGAIILFHDSNYKSVQKFAMELAKDKRVKIRGLPQDSLIVVFQKR